MKFEITREENFEHGGTLIRFKGELTLDEIEMLRLDPIERAQIAHSGTCAADHLLDLEMLYRRHAEQTKNPPTSKEPTHAPE